MFFVLGLHLLAAICAPLLVRWWGRQAFLPLALAPLSAVGWALAHTQQAFHQPVVEQLNWVPALGLTVAFRLDVLSWLMMLIVGGVGALVMVYASRYFAPDARSLGRFAGVFVAFAGSMLGLVTADHTMAVYMFWEFTTVLSYLLIGHHHQRGPARAAARQAILVTTSGALAMFAGLVMLGLAPGGSFRLSELVANAQSGVLATHSPLVVTAAVLVLIGALTKSAQFPFHFWLPGAMAAPTPVSAYLHAAAMVKAGVYLVARLTPGFAEVPLWSPVVVTFGLITMLIGSYRALRQYDLKLILAFGTVSQLGLMMAAVGFGTQEAMAAGLVLLVAHSLFKSALFLTVGAVESSTGTRDLRELSGLWRHKPVLAIGAGVAALSMAGLPLTTGYLGKEALLTDLLHRSWPVLVIVVLGAMLTLAYSWRFWWGAFATKRLRMERPIQPVSPMMRVPILLLAAGALLGLAPGWLELVAAPPAQGLPGSVHLAWWSGWGPGLATLLIVAGGLALILNRPKVARWQRQLAPRGGLVRVYTWSLVELELVAAQVTSLLHRGSLPGELSTIFVTMVVLAAVALTRVDVPSQPVVLWDSPVQAALVVLAIGAALIAARSLRRMKAVLALAATGMLITLLFATQGAPDLALTQLVVEAVSIVVFVLVLRNLPPYFSKRPLSLSRWWRGLVGASVGVVVAVGGWVAAASRIHEPVSNLMPEEALGFGNGQNVVNVILVDMRAWDTVGELSVLLVTATGVASLIYLKSRSGQIDKAPPAALAEGQYLPGAAALKPQDRSLVLEVATRVLFPAMLVLSIWLLLVGHNNPGGGFAGGVVAGLAFVLRYLAGGRFELGEAMPFPAGRLLGFGLFVAAAGGAAPLLFGNAVLQSTPVDLTLGPLGDLHFTTAMILDIGVYLLVIGLVIDLVSALGAEIDRHNEASRPVPLERRIL
ncbi:Na+/H+ antiporter subunit A [Scrofimicrobium sp. R131]|uniref:Na+/H+ antiporter subunit A n=1 Tax=Scrofimicrobium appendicitidis TaxID=3079930 RepID=A0AAU7V831_9ACTO